MAAPEIIPASFDWFEFVQRGGAVSAVFLLVAVLWLVKKLEQKEQIIVAKDGKLESLAEETIKSLAILIERSNKGGAA